MNNVTLNDIKELEKKSHIELTPDQRICVLNEYNRVVVDKGESWDEILRDLINGCSKR